jgi:hypothetical protein
MTAEEAEPTPITVGLMVPIKDYELVPNFTFVVMIAGDPVVFRLLRLERAALFANGDRCTVFLCSAESTDTLHSISFSDFKNFEYTTARLVELTNPLASEGLALLGQMMSEGVA